MTDQNNTTFFAPELHIPTGTFDIDFYTRLGATEHFCFRNDDGSVHVAELEISGAVFHLHETVSWFDALEPKSAKGVTAVIGLFVPDVNEVMRKAVEAGATEISPATDHDYGYRQGMFQDPFGHYWQIQKKSNRTAMNKTAERYIASLRQAYYDNNARASWDHFEKIKQGATKEDIEMIKQIFPDTPGALIGLLKYVDGTYYREYAGETITFYFLGSDMEEYPYYLLSSKEMIENQNQAIKYYADYIERQYDEVEIDDRITNKADTIQWLHFSDCMNNGGTSQLFIDFSPSKRGIKGQVVRFLHDPDELKVIADSFEDYLQKLMDNEFDFINEEA